MKKKSRGELAISTPAAAQMSMQQKSLFQCSVKDTKLCLLRKVCQSTPVNNEL